MNDIERVTQAIGRGEIQPPSLAPMQPNRNQGPLPMPVSYDFFELAAPLRVNPIPTTYGLNQHI